MTWARATTSSTARGYGAAHRKLRAALAIRHQPTDPCVRCGHALGPMGAWLHLDHNNDRTAYLGFSHGRRPCPTCGARCNIRAGARKARANQVRMAKAMQVLGGCPICGDAIPTGRIYCSQRCGYLAHKDDPPRTPTPRKAKQPKPTAIRERQCQVCSTTYIGDRIYCSNACMTESNARKARERYRKQQGLTPTWERARNSHATDASRW